METQKMKMGKITPGYKGNTGQESLYQDEIQSFVNSINNKQKYPFHSKMN